VVPLQLGAVTEQHLAHQVDDLAEFRGVFSRVTIERHVSESLEQFANARVTAFLPVLAHRFARERLQALGQAEGRIAKAVPEVLFVCVHNAGRSQMASALLATRAKGRVHVRSAGSEPAEAVNPAVVEAMSELGIDISEHFPKPLADEVVQAADVVITMGCGDACPLYSGKRYEDWQLDDPAGRPVEEVRLIRDELDKRIEALLAELATPHNSRGRGYGST
jgi:protein-tyrosine-phosphatase